MTLRVHVDLPPLAPHLQLGSSMPFQQLAAVASPPQHQPEMMRPWLQVESSNWESVKLFRDGCRKQRGHHAEGGFASHSKLVMTSSHAVSQSQKHNGLPFPKRAGTCALFSLSVGHGASRVLCRV